MADTLPAPSAGRLQARRVSKTDIWMPLYIGDYLAGTRRLSTLQHGAYLLLLMEYWRSGPLPDDDEQLAVIAGMDARSWRAQATSVRRFFTPGSDGLLHQKRADIELARTAAIQAKRRSAARARHGLDGAVPDAHADAYGDAHAGAHAGANAGANAGALGMHVDTHAHCRATVTATDLSVPSERRGGAAREASGVRHEFWVEGLATFRRMTGRTENASRRFLGQLLRTMGDDCARAMALIHQAQADRPGDPATWLLAAARARVDGRRGRDEHKLSRAAQMRRVAEIFDMTAEDSSI